MLTPVLCLKFYAQAIFKKKCFKRIQRSREEMSSNSLGWGSLPSLSNCHDQGTNLVPSWPRAKISTKESSSSFCYILNHLIIFLFHESLLQHELRDVWRGDIKLILMQKKRGMKMVLMSKDIILCSFNRSYFYYTVHSKSVCRLLFLL